MIWDAWLWTQNEFHMHVDELQTFRRDLGEKAYAAQAAACASLEQALTDQHYKEVKTLQVGYYL